MAQNNGTIPKRDEGIPILIPEESILEGFIKTKKSFKIESNFYGTLLSTQKVIIDANSTVHGDIICSELIISGTFEGNIFAPGKSSAMAMPELLVKYIQSCSRMRTVVI